MTLAAKEDQSTEIPFPFILGLFSSCTTSVHKHDRYLNHKIKEGIEQALLECFILEDPGIIRYTIKDSSCLPEGKKDGL